MAGTGWVVSLSAPIVTPEEEQKEKDDLTAEELADVNAELYGEAIFGFDQIEQNRKRLSEVIEEFEDCVRNKLPKMSTKTYFEALEAVPHIVKEETDPIMFLRCEHYNVEKAAARLATYWKERKLLFGKERAFLPMTLLPDGAMGCSEKDMQQLRFFHIARAPDDDHGRAVIFVDRASTTKSLECDRDCWLRSFWYHCHAISQDPKYQRNGYVIVVNLKDYETSKYRLGAKKWFMYIRECLCPRLKAYHASYGSHQSPVKLILPAIRAMQGRHIRLHLINHYGYISDNIKAMEKYGLGKRHMPVALEGSFELQDHLSWIKERRRCEEKHQSLFSTRQCTKNNNWQPVSKISIEDKYDVEAAVQP